MVRKIVVCYFSARMSQKSQKSLNGTIKLKKSFPARLFFNHATEWLLYDLIPENYNNKPYSKAHICAI